VYSGQNALYFLGPPPTSARTVVAVGMSPGFLATQFANCRRAGTLENHLGVDNEEEGRALEVCTGPRRPWPLLWPEFRHND
jgi:hypothetical protein